MSASGAPLSNEEIDRLLAPLEATQHALIAVSGGPDSTALLLMAQRWADERDGARITAATVNHGLRPEAAKEALHVARLCARLSIPHTILTWTGVRPQTRVQERARDARYELLSQHAREICADAIVTAHHADDQAETVLFRLIRGSGVTGLRGMASATHRGELLHLRPLLALKKADLVAYCEAHREPFLQDPSNEDPRFARVRMRRVLKALSDEGLGGERFARVARRLSEADDAIASMTDAFDEGLGPTPIVAAALFRAPTAVVHRVLLRRIADAGGRDSRRVRLDRVEALAAALRRAQAGRTSFSANVGGAWIRLSSGGLLRFEPEPPRRPARSQPPAGG